MPIPPVPSLASFVTVVSHFAVGTPVICSRCTAPCTQFTDIRQSCDTKLGSTDKHFLEVRGSPLCYDNVVAPIDKVKFEEFARTRYEFIVVVTEFEQ